MATMKKLILLALTALIMVECYQAKAYHNEKISLVDGYRIKTIVYQDCEYAVIDNQRVSMTHKGNCRFCKERRQKELEELVIKLKEK